MKSDDFDCFILGWIIGISLAQGITHWNPLVLTIAPLSLLLFYNKFKEAGK